MIKKLDDTIPLFQVNWDPILMLGYLSQIQVDMLLKISPCQNDWTCEREGGRGGEKRGLYIVV